MAPVPGAAGYNVFRTDDVVGCDLGKVKVGAAGGTSFTDVDVRGGVDVRDATIRIREVREAARCERAWHRRPPLRRCCTPPLSHTA